MLEPPEQQQQFVTLASGNDSQNMQMTIPYTHQQAWYAHMTIPFSCCLNLLLVLCLTNTHGAVLCHVDCQT